MEGIFDEQIENLKQHVPPGFPEELWTSHVDWLCHISEPPESVFSRHILRCLIADADRRKAEAEEGADEELEFEDPEVTFEREAREYAQFWAKITAKKAEDEVRERGQHWAKTVEFLGGQSAGAQFAHLILIDAYITSYPDPVRPDMRYRATLPGGGSAWRATLPQAREAIIEHIRSKADVVSPLREGPDPGQ